MGKRRYDIIPVILRMGKNEKILVKRKTKHENNFFVGLVVP
jgi:hypothetical protein